jgi:hypothetical protein
MDFRLLSSLFERNSSTTSAVNPPVETRLPAISAALAMQNGHIGSSACRDAAHRTRATSALFFTH